MSCSTQLQNRSDLIGEPVVSRSSRNRLGIINQLWIDPDLRQVAALGIRNTLITGPQRYMLFDHAEIANGSIWSSNDQAVFDPFDVRPYTTLIGYEVITEVGELLGKVRGFSFELETGMLQALTIDALGLPLIPMQLCSRADSL